MSHPHLLSQELSALPTCYFVPTYSTRTSELVREGICDARRYLHYHIRYSTLPRSLRLFGHSLLRISTLRVRRYWAESP